MTDEDVERFLRVVSDLGKDDPKGRARGQAVMQRMGWDPSDLLLGNPSNEEANRHGRRYRALAKHCDNEGYITWEADRYAWVAITPKGEGRISGG